MTSNWRMSQFPLAKGASLWVLEAGTRKVVSKRKRQPLVHTLDSLGLGKVASITPGPQQNLPAHLSSYNFSFFWLFEIGPGHVAQVSWPWTWQPPGYWEHHTFSRIGKEQTAGSWVAVSSLLRPHMIYICHLKYLFLFLEDNWVCLFFFLMLLNFESC